MILVEIPFDEITPAEIAQYEQDPSIVVEIDGDSEMVFVLSIQ